MNLETDIEPPPYHALSAGDVVARLATDPDRGLPSAEVARRRTQFGANRLPGDTAPSLFVLLLRQFSDLLIVVLLAAALVADLIGEALDAIAILVIVVLNVLVGFVQEYRAERALKALQDMSAPQVDVLPADAPLGDRVTLVHRGTQCHARARARRACWPVTAPR